MSVCSPNTGRRRLRGHKNGRNTDPSFSEFSSLQVDDGMELLDISLTVTYFKFEDKFYQQEEILVCWKGVKIMQIEFNSKFRKYKESTHMSLVAHPISPPSLDISLIWTPIIAAEVREL
jgi:hypothetical protein